MAGSPSTDRQLTVVIPSYGNHDGLAAVLDGLDAQRCGGFETIVVVDRDDPDPAAAARAIGPRPYPVRMLRGDAPGASANRNAGWRAAGTPLILMIDNDTVPRPGLVGEHLSWHARNPDPMLAVLGLVRWSPAVRVTPFMRWLDQGPQFDYPAIRGIDAGWGRFYSANISVKRSLLERLDGFDQNRFPYGYEDLDLALRARPLGLRVFFNRAAVVDHRREYDLAFFRRRVRRIAVAERAFADAHPGAAAHFHTLFTTAAAAPPARGRGRFLYHPAVLALPLIGDRVRASADLYFRQRLAPDFLSAWSEAADPSGPLVGEHEAG